MSEGGKKKKGGTEREKETRSEKLKNSLIIINFNYFS